MYYIDRQMFHNLCDRYGVPADNGLRAWLLTWFNDLGVCFSYHLDKNGQEQSVDYKILEPMWLTSAVYKIIWEKDRTDDGLIPLSEIYRILEKPGSDAMKKDGIPCLENVSYTKEECNYILDIMRMFRISYPADTCTEFMPTLCNPDSKLDPLPKTWKQHVAYRFRYTFLPENVLHRLMIFCFANLRPGKRWRKGFWLECEAQGLSAVIRNAGDNSEENELQIDVYAQKEQYEAWMWLQPLCQQITEINNTLSLKAEIFIFAENDCQQQWVPLDKIWYWKNQGAKTLQGERSYFYIQSLMDLIYGRCLPDVEKKLISESNGYRFSNHQESFLQSITTRVADLVEIDMSRPFDEQQDKKNFVAALKRSNDLREKEIDVIQKHTDAIKENTSVSRENTLSIQQVNELLYAIRDGRIELPENLMAALIESFQQCDKPTLQTARHKMQRLSWKERGQMLREFLGDAANLTTVAPVLIKLGINYGPALLKLIVTAVPI